jgi:hypothetical protein
MATAESELQQPGAQGGEANATSTSVSKVEASGTIVGVDRWPIIRRWWATIEGWGISRMNDPERGALLHILGRAAEVPALVPITDEFLAGLSGQLLVPGLDRARRLQRELQKALAVPGYEPPRPSVSADPDIAAIVGLVKAAAQPVSMLYLYRQFCRSVRDIPLTSFKKKLSLLSRPGGPIMKTGKRGLYAPPTADGLPHASISQCIAQVVPTIPPYAISWTPFRAALKPYGFTVNQIYGGLNQMRNVNGFLAKADRSLKGLVAWSADSIAKFERGEPLRNDFGEILWSPDFSLVKANPDAPPEAPRSEASTAAKASAPELVSEQEDLVEAGELPPASVGTPQVQAGLYRVPFPAGLDPKVFTALKLRWLDECRVNPKITPLAFRALHALASHYLDRESGTAWLGHKRFAREVGGSRRGLQKALNGVVAAGVLSASSEAGAAAAVRDSPTATGR